jgi:hypothetical protein
MPREIVKPGALNFDPDVPVNVRLSFKPKLVFALFAFKLLLETRASKRLVCACIPLP